MRSFRDAATFIFLLLLALSVRIGPIDGDTPPLIPEAQAAPVVAERSDAAPDLEAESAARTMRFDVDGPDTTATVRSQRSIPLRRIRRIETNETELILILERDLREVLETAAPGCLVPGATNFAEPAVRT